MSSKKLFIAFSFCLLPLVSCTYFDINRTRNEFINKVINYEEIKNKIQNELSESDDTIFAAFKMFDASTKIPSGLAVGNWMDLGNFDECYNIEYVDKYGKYCLGKLSYSLETKKYFDVFRFNATVKQKVLSVHPRLIGLGAEYVGIYFAACVPSSWKASEIPGLINYTEEFCYSKATEPQLSDGAIATITVLSIFFVITVVSTAFDVYLYYTKKKLPYELLIAFSLLTNGRKLFKSSNDSNQLLCLNGLRALSMMWVVLGHSYSLAMIAPLSNFFYLNEFQKELANMFVIGATVSVDTFFVIGGLVTVYSYMKSNAKGVKFNIFFYYLHRYLRITPALAIMALIHLYLLNYLATGPLWKAVDISLVKTCETGWWSTFLYITNFVKKDVCLPQAWYLSVDMQLFILSPLILIPLTKWPKIALSALGILTVAGCVIPFIIGYTLNIGSLNDADGQDVFMDAYYIQTYARFGPYVIGMITGYLVYKIKSSQLKIDLTKPIVCILWLILLAGLTACVYAGYPLNVATEEDRWGNALFLAFNRPAWAVSVSGVILLCTTGYGGIIDKFLSLSIFQFLAKVSYSIYLVHFAVVTVRYAAMKTTMKFSNLIIMHNFWGDFMFSLVLSIVLCLSFESPIIILEKYLFGRSVSKTQQKSELSKY